VAPIVSLQRAVRLAALLCSVAAAGAAHAVVYVVNTTTDDATPSGCEALIRAATGTLPTDACSLRSAILKANALSGPDEIIVNLPGAQTIVLGTQVEITQDLLINAAPLTGWTGTVLLSGLTIAGPTGVDLFKIIGGNT